jgi:phosphatidylglycerophosphate synthase
LAWLALGLFAVRIWTERSIWREAGGFGAANLLTGVRVLMIASLSLLPPDRQVPWAGAIVLGTFVLDGLDGFVARLTGNTSRFGAQFDQEADAFTVATATHLAVFAGLMPVWFVIAGLLRYVYVITVWLLGARAEAPRSRLARWVYSAFVVGLLAILMVPSATTRWLAGGATLALIASFARSFVYVIRAARGQPPPQPDL